MAEASEKHMDTLGDSTSNNTVAVENQSLQPIPPITPLPSPLDSPGPVSLRPGHDDDDDDLDDLEAARTEARYAQPTHAAARAAMEIGDTRLSTFLVHIITLISLLCRFILLVCMSTLYARFYSNGILFKPFYYSLLQCLPLESLNLMTATVVTFVRTLRMRDSMARDRVMTQVFGAAACVTLALWLTTVATVIEAWLRAADGCGKL
ncbi:MAG: hypothetical protein Q9163_005680 [Psora crenata]